MLFNPWAIGQALDFKELGPYWVESGQSRALRLDELTTLGQVPIGPLISEFLICFAMRTNFVRI